MSDRLRVAIALPSRRGPRWVRTTLKGVREVADLVSVLVPPTIRPSHASSLWRLWEAVDAAVFGRQTAGHALEEVDLLDGLPTGSAPADLLLWLRPEPPPHPDPAYPLGTWCLEHEGGLAGGVLAGDTTAVSALRVALPDRGDLHLLTTESSLDPHSLFFSRNPALAKAAALPARALARVAADGWEATLAAAQAARDLRSTAPAAPQAVLAGLRTVARLATAIRERRRTREEWCLFYRRAGAELPPRVSGSEMKAIRPPPGEWFADPFIRARPDGGADVFFERCPAEGKGVIAHLAIDSDGAVGRPRTVLELDHHLSYPCVFEHQGATWMIPETRASRTIQLFRAVDYPYRWELERTLVSDVEAVDATFFVNPEDPGRLWLFAAVAVPGGSTRDELCLFHAEQLTGPWHPHPQNPVVSTVRRARPAGALFQRDGALLRPSQDNSAGYGGAVVLSRVETLTPTVYREVQVARIEPGPGLHGVHTWNACSGWEVADGLRREPRT